MRDTSLDSPAVQTRRGFLGKSTLAAAGAAAGAALVGQVDAQQGNPNFVPTLYRGWNGKNFRSIQQHENEHVTFLVGALGAAARPKPTFQGLEQANVQAFLSVSQALENTGVGAYLGAAPIIQSSAYLAAAGSIATIEARHAGYLNVLLNQPITQSGENFETPFTVAQVVAAAGPFVASLNGGPPLDFSSTPSPENDVAILNFALALEYLEAEFYNVNVPKFM